MLYAAYALYAIKLPVGRNMLYFAIPYVDSTGLYCWPLWFHFYLKYLTIKGPGDDARPSRPPSGGSWDRTL